MSSEALTLAEQEGLKLLREAGTHLAVPLLRALVAGNVAEAEQHLRIALAASAARAAVTAAAKAPTP